MKLFWSIFTVLSWSWTIHQTQAAPTQSQSLFKRGNTDIHKVSEVSLWWTFILVCDSQMMNQYHFCSVFIEHSPNIISSLKIFNIDGQDLLLVPVPRPVGAPAPVKCPQCVFLTSLLKRMVQSSMWDKRHPICF